MLHFHLSLESMSKDKKFKLISDRLIKISDFTAMQYAQTKASISVAVTHDNMNQIFAKIYSHVC